MADGEGNVIEGGEFAFLIKSSGQQGACGRDCGTAHVTIRDNVIRDTRGGANLSRLTARAERLHPTWASCAPLALGQGGLPA